MVVSSLLPMYLEFAFLVVPKTGDTSMGQFVLKSLAFCAVGTKLVYDAVKRKCKAKHRLKFNQAKNYPDVRLDINGNFYYYCV